MVVVVRTSSVTVREDSGDRLLLRLGLRLLKVGPRGARGYQRLLQLLLQLYLVLQRWLLQLEEDLTSSEEVSVVASTRVAAEAAWQLVEEHVRLIVSISWLPL